MTATIVLPSSTFSLERKAALCALVGEFFLRNPDTILVRAMKNLDITLFDERFTKEFRPIKEYAASCGETEKDEKFLNLKRDWTKLFRGVSPVYGPTAPYACLFLEGNSTQLMEDMAAEQKARTTYDNILRLIHDQEVCDPIRFLRAREIVHFQRFGEANREDCSKSKHTKYNH